MYEQLTNSDFEYAQALLAESEPQALITTLELLHHMPNLTIDGSIELDIGVQDNNEYSLLYDGEILYLTAYNNNSSSETRTKIDFKGSEIQ